MSATPRDLQKPRSQRIAEVYNSLQLQSGQANSQLVSFGCALSPDTDTTKFQVSAGEYVLGQAVVKLTAKTAQTVPSGAATSAGQSCIVLIEADATGTLFKTVGAVTTGTPVPPSPDPTRIVLGVLLIPASFAVGTTSLTTNECVSQPYNAGDVNPAGTQSRDGSTGGF